MTAIRSTLDPSSGVFRENRDAMVAHIEVLDDLLDKAMAKYLRSEGFAAGECFVQLLSLRS